ncbi:hypothetical protein B0H11DRAFT_2209102 [Mycena galericulata]|nr:hypothetical protein B0H11DRAFT_2209102 [Mycena galericulata]
MFVFAMVGMALQIVSTTLNLQKLYAAVHSEGQDGQLNSSTRMSDALVFVEFSLLVANNAITDLFLTYRCYLIWGTSHNSKVVILPLFLVLVTTVVGGVTIYGNLTAPPQHHLDIRIAFGLAMTTNFILTCLTVGRIWWTRRHLKLVGQTKIIQRCNTAMAMLFVFNVHYEKQLLISGPERLESSVLYFLVWCIGMIASSFPGSNLDTGSPATNLFYGFADQLMNIIPTLVIVQANRENQSIQAQPMCCRHLKKNLLNETVSLPRVNSKNSKYNREKYSDITEAS